MIEKVISQSDYYINSAKSDIKIIEHTRVAIMASMRSKEPLLVSMEGTSDYVDIKIQGERVLTVVNLQTTPVVPQLDTVSLSQLGKLNDALDVRPFMLSGPCPTTILWSGSSEFGLTNDDANKAFKYWLQFIFGVSVDPNTGLFVGV